MTVNLPPQIERVVREAVRSGHYRSAEDVLVEAVGVWQRHQEAGTRPAPDQREEAIERLRTFGKNNGLSLGGMTIRELRHEARP